MLDIAFISTTLDKYGLAHLDAKKVLLKMGGRRPGKRCKNGWIAAEKQCSDHKTADGKLTDAGKNSARELADKVRQRKGLTANGGAKKKGDEFNHVEGLSDLKEQWGAPLNQAIALSKKYGEVATIDDAINGVEGTLTALKSAIGSGQKTFKAKVSGPEMETSRWSVDALSSALDKNNQERTQIVNAKGLDPDFKPSRMIDNISIIDSIKKESKRKGAITGAIFKDGKMEAAYVASSSSTSPSLSLDYLASNPSNFMGQKTSKGAGKQAILELIEVSKKLGKGGSINLVPLDGAIGFYTKLGFKPSSNGLLLSSEDAAKLQSTSRRRSDSTNDHESNEFYLVSKDLNMDFDFVTATLEKYGLAHLDAKKVLLKMGGRRPGKHCVGKAGGKGSYIAAEKQCGGHKGADGKLTQAGKQSARELAARVRDRKGMGTQMETKVGRMPMRDFIADIKGKPTEKIITPMMRKIHKEARSDLNKRRIKGGRSAIVDKKAPRTPKSASDKPITQRSDSTDRAIRYVSKVRRSNHQLRLDDWKRLGRDQMGQKCGRGWHGLRGACKRVPKGGDKDAAIKASKLALADKIRAKKGLRDRNAPKVEPKPKDFIPHRMEYSGGRGGSKPWLAHVPGTTDNKYGLTRDFVEADKIHFSKSGKVEKAFFNLKKPGVYVDSEGDHFLVKANPKTGKLDTAGLISKNEVYHAIKNDRDRWNQLNDPFHKDSDDSTHFDSTEILRYTRAIAVLNDRYGWHLDAQKVLSKLGKKLGKKCGGGWIAPEKKCKSHYTDGKLNAAGKASGENLADRIRQRKSLSTVSRNGKGQELSYAFLPGNQKQSTMTARRTHAPKSGYQTPGRLSNLNSTEERRSMVGLGQHPGMKQQPDNAPIMDTPTTTASATRKMNANPSAGDRIRAIAQTLKDQDKIQKVATVGVLKVAEKLYTNQNKMIDEVSTMVNKDLDRAAAKGGKKTFEPTQPQSDPVAKASGGAPTGETQTRRMNTAVVGSGAGDRLRAIAGKLKDEESVQKVATVGVLKVAEKLYVNQHKMIGEVAGIVNEDLNNAAAKGVRKIFDPAQTPVRIPNQRSSKAPRSIGRSVD